MRTTLIQSRPQPGSSTPAAPGIAERSLADHVEEHAENRAAQVALVYAGKGIEIARARLDADANRFSNLRRSLGMQRGDVLGIHLPNTPQYVAAPVGAVKAGVVVSGVSPLFTPPDITHQVDDAHVQVLCTLDRLYASAMAPIDG